MCERLISPLAREVSRGLLLAYAATSLASWSVSVLGWPSGMFALMNAAALGHQKEYAVNAVALSAGGTRPFIEKRKQP